MASTLPVKVYYEDTDCLGVVYHANYLRYFERGRTEHINAMGRSISDWNDAGFNYAVFKLEITFFKPARLNDKLSVITEITPEKSLFRLPIKQRIERDGELLCEQVVQLVCLDANMQLREFPDELLGK